MPDIYLTICTLPDGSTTEVGVPRADALTWGRDEFAELYRRTVCGSKKKEALAWADDQIAQRAAVYREATFAAL